MAEKHALLTGDTRRFGNQVQLEDGTVVDTAAQVIYLDSLEEVAEVAHAIGLAHKKHGHPDDVDFDEKTGPVQRKFVYDDSHHKKHGRRAGKKG